MGSEGSTDLPLPRASGWLAARMGALPLGTISLLVVSSAAVLALQQLRPMRLR